MRQKVNNFQVKIAWNETNVPFLCCTCLCFRSIIMTRNNLEGSCPSKGMPGIIMWSFPSQLSGFVQHSALVLQFGSPGNFKCKCICRVAQENSIRILPRTTASHSALFDSFFLPVIYADFSITKKKSLKDLNKKTFTSYFFLRLSLALLLRET